jgi:shikimate O-hydroxycinnamoyltransferase
VLGSATNHNLMDGRSVFYFFQTWACIARGELDSVIPPSFDNTLLHARSPPTITSDHPEYRSCHDQVKNTVTPSLCVVTKLKLSNEQICSLKSQCTDGSSKTRISTFCVISALFWKCYCIAQELPPGTNTRLQFTADIRERLQPPLPQEFFGNAVIRTSATADASKITSNPISIAASSVKAAIDGITDEYIRSFIDYVEVNQDKKLAPVRELPKSDLRIASIAGMPVYEADFGWGAPQLLTWAQANGTNVIYVINEPGKDAGVVAFVLLDQDTMHKFEKVFYEELCVGAFRRLKSNI